MPPDRGASAAAPPPSPAGRRAHLPIDEALAPFADMLRHHLPTPDEIEQAAAQRQRARTARRAQLGIVACVAVAAALWADPALQRQTLATAQGERGQWTLADGSTVELNTASRVEVAQHLRSRRLTLAEGEAVFQVAHAPWHALAPRLERPFTVQAGALQVQDIGTVFHMHRHPAKDDATDVAVLQGRVRVHAGDHGGAPVELHAGQRLRADGRAPLAAPEPTGDSAEAALAWREGRLVLDATPLADAVATMQRHRRAPITVADPQAAALRISGQFDLDRIDQLLDLLPQLAPVQVLRQPDGAVVIAARPAGRP